MVNTNKQTTLSPLPFKKSVHVLATVVALNVAVFGLIIASLLIFKELRIHTPIILACTIPMLSVLILFVIKQYIYRSGLSWSAVGLRKPTLRLLHLFWQIPAMIVALIITQVLVFVVLNTEPVSGSNGIDNLIRNVPVSAALSIIIGICLLIPVWEELIFRGIIYAGLRRKYHILISLILSGVAFACIHIIPILFPYLFVMGVCLALLYEFHRNLWANIIAHAAINILASLPVLIYIISKST